MASQEPHRIFAGLIILIYLFTNGYFVLSFPYYIVIGLIIAAIFGGGRPWDRHVGLSPDIDLIFHHRNPITHSTIIPLVLIWLYSSSANPSILWNNILIFILISWWSHVLLDLITEGDRLNLEISPEKWSGGRITYGIVIFTVIGTLILLLGYTPYKIQLLGV